MLQYITVSDVIFSPTFPQSKHSPDADRSGGARVGSRTSGVGWGPHAWWSRTHSMGAAAPAAGVTPIERATRSLRLAMASWCGVASSFILTCTLRAVAAPCVAPAATNYHAHYSRFICIRPIRIYNVVSFWYVKYESIDTIFKHQTNLTTMYSLRP